ncbi:MAG: sensor histidine kinase, partial [Mariniphaga sp.]|nr:sensor histidine kinase [Mariniphaga sp.]
LYIENAIKYSPDSHTVTVNFIHVDTKLIITIENLGPLVSPEELKMIGEKGVRGKYAEELKFGSGIGLFLANSICNLHDIHFSYESSGIINDINKIPYKTFTVKLEVCENN